MGNRSQAECVTVYFTLGEHCGAKMSARVDHCGYRSFALIIFGALVVARLLSPTCLREFQVANCGRRSREAWLSSEHFCDSRLLLGRLSCRRAATSPLYYLDPRLFYFQPDPPAFIDPERRRVARLTVRDTRAR
jgi:hypothetical protein